MTLDLCDRASMLRSQESSKWVAARWMEREERIGGVRIREKKKKRERFWATFAFFNSVAMVSVSLVCPLVPLLCLYGPFIGLWFQRCSLSLSLSVSMSHYSPFFLTVCFLHTSILLTE